MKKLFVLCIVLFLLGSIGYVSYVTIINKQLTTLDTPNLIKLASTTSEKVSQNPELINYNKNSDGEKDNPSTKIIPVKTSVSNHTFMDKNKELDTTSIEDIADTFIQSTSLEAVTALINALYPSNYTTFASTVAKTQNANIQTTTSPEVLAEFIFDIASERPATAYTISYPSPNEAMINFTANNEDIRGMSLKKSAGHWYIITPEDVLFYEVFLSEKVTPYLVLLRLKVNDSHLDKNGSMTPPTIRLTTKGQWVGESARTQTIEFTAGTALGMSNEDDSVSFSASFLLPDSLKNTPISIDIVGGDTNYGTLDFSIQNPQQMDNSVITEIKNKEVAPNKQYTLHISK